MYKMRNMFNKLSIPCNRKLEKKMWRGQKRNRPHFALAKITTKGQKWNRPQMSLNKRRRISNMKMTEILIIIVNISIFILPIVMLIENLIKGRYRVLNICMLINMFAWVYLSYLWNVRNPGFWIKCDTRILTLISSILFIASIIAFAIQLKHKKGNKLLIMIAIIFVYYIIMTNDTT